MSDHHFVECFLDGIDKQMATNTKKFKNSLANKVRYEVRTAFETYNILYQIKRLMCQQQSTEDVLSKLQGNSCRQGFESWCAAEPRDNPTEPCSNPPVRSEAAAAAAARLSAEDDVPTERCLKLPAMLTAAAAKRRKNIRTRRENRRRILQPYQM